MDDEQRLPSDLMGDIREGRRVMAGRDEVVSTIYTARAGVPLSTPVERLITVDADKAGAIIHVASDLAGLLQLVIDNQIRNGWVREDSPLLDEPRKALERWHELHGG